MEHGSTQHFWEVAKHFHNGMMVSLTKDTCLHSRPMRVLKATEAEGFWFMTSLEAPKIDELKAHKKVALTFQSSDRYLSVSGQAVTSQDKAKIHELWSDSMKPWFPQGKDDPSITLIHVLPDCGEYWDFAGVAQKIRFAFEASKSVIHHEKIDVSKLGEHGKVDLHTAEHRK